MASHFVSFAQGVEGSKYSDFTVSTSTAATNLFEFRILDGVTPKQIEVIKALEAFERFFSNPQQVSAAGFDVAS